jgi:cytochrome c553
VRARIVAIVLLVCAAASIAAAQTRPPPPVPTTIPQMWDAWCARCHAKDGTGNVAETTVKIKPRGPTAI